MINKEVIENLKLNKNGLTIAELVEKTQLKRCQIRTTIAFLLGADKISERRIGMAKLYILK